jgi:hypothetical protein
MKTGCVLLTNLLESEAILIFQYWADTIKLFTVNLLLQYGNGSFVLLAFVSETVGDSNM